MAYMLNITPMASLGAFTLHSKFSEVYSELRHNFTIYSYIDMVFDPSSTTAPMWLISQREGFRFRFNGESQRLDLIEIEFDQAKASKKKTSVYLKSKSLRPLEQQYSLTYDFISAIMGPTFPLQYSKDSKLAEQRYVDGILFLYNVKPKVDMSKDMQIKKILIYSMSNISNALSNYKLFYPVIQGAINYGLQFISKEYSEWINFGDTLDHVLYVLKNPQKAYNMKTEISNSPMPYSINHPYSLNYFTYGLDIIMDGITQKVIKFILHNNDPFHPQFNDYDRCNYFITSEDQGIVELKVDASINNQHNIDYEDLSVLYNDNSEYGVSFIEKEIQCDSKTLCRGIVFDILNSAIVTNDKEKKEANKKSKYAKKDELYNIAKKCKDCMDSGLYVTNKTNWETAKKLLQMDQLRDESCFEKNWPTYKTKTKYYGKDGIIVETTWKGAINTITLYKANCN